MDDAEETIFHARIQHRWKEDDVWHKGTRTVCDLCEGVLKVEHIFCCRSHAIWEEAFYGHTCEKEK